SDRDWSSDVCSSDLAGQDPFDRIEDEEDDQRAKIDQQAGACAGTLVVRLAVTHRSSSLGRPMIARAVSRASNGRKSSIRSPTPKIGRASCRERGESD